ncbi:MAG: sugar phosphate isomerase/epimerase [Spirochaetaceae bacterium]
MDISVCLDAIFGGQDMTESMKKVKQCGIDIIEFWDWSDKDLDILEAQLDKLDMKISTFCTKSTSLVDSDQHESYLRELSDSLNVVKRFGVKQLISLVGHDTGSPRISQRNNMIEGLRKCVPLLEDAGIILMIEPQMF